MRPFSCGFENYPRSDALTNALTACGRGFNLNTFSMMMGSETYLDGEAAMAPAASFVHVGARHFSHRATLFDERQHVCLALYNELAQPDDTEKSNEW